MIRIGSIIILFLTCALISGRAFTGQTVLLSTINWPSYTGEYYQGVAFFQKLSQKRLRKLDMKWNTSIALGPVRLRKPKMALLMA